MILLILLVFFSFVCLSVDFFKQKMILLHFYGGAEEKKKKERQVFLFLPLTNLVDILYRLVPV